MAGYYEEIVINYTKGLQEKAQKVSDEVSNIVGKEADKHAIKKMINAAREYITSLYHDAAMAWYDAYDPVRYKRKYSLLNAMYLAENDEGLSWYVDEKMMKQSWSGGYYNIYKYIFERGSHGGPVRIYTVMHDADGGKYKKLVDIRMPVYTTSIYDMFGLFDESSDEYQDTYNMLQGMIYEDGEAYFEEYFPQEFQKYFKL